MKLAYTKPSLDGQVSTAVVVTVVVMVMAEIRSTQDRTC